MKILSTTCGLLGKTLFPLKINIRADFCALCFMFYALCSMGKLTKLDLAFRMILRSKKRLFSLKDRKKPLNLRIVLIGRFVGIILSLR